MKNNSARSALLILLAGALWGTMGIFVRRFNSFGFDAMQVASMRLTAGAVIFIIVLALRGGKGGFGSGFILQFVNAKIYIYCIVSMEAYILPYYQGDWPALTLFALLLAFIGFLLTLCWSAFGSAFKLLFSRYARVTNTVMALLLVYCAVSLFL